MFETFSWDDYVWYFGIPLAFLVVVAWIYRPSAKKRYEEDAEIPLHEQEEKPPRAEK